MPDGARFTDDLNFALIRMFDSVIDGTARTSGGAPRSGGTDVASPW
jgi:hypothetical protein